MSSQLAESMSKNDFPEISSSGQNSNNTADARRFSGSGGNVYDDDDADLKLALALSRAEAFGSDDSGAYAAEDADDGYGEQALKDSQQDKVETNDAKESPSVDEAADLALALSLQEEEEAALETFRAYEQKNFAGKVKLRSRFRTPEEIYAAQLSAATPENVRYSADDADALKAEMDSIRDAFAEELGSGVKTNGQRLPPWPVRNKALKGQGGDEEIITKHDSEISAQRNWAKLANDPRTGKAGSGPGNHKISNRVYNSLKHNMRKQQNTTKGLSATVERDTMQTHAKGLDQRARLTLQKLLNAGLLEEVNGIVRTGKEAVVFHATGLYDSAAEYGEDILQHMPEEASELWGQNGTEDSTNKDASPSTGEVAEESETSNLKDYGDTITGMVPSDGEEDEDSVHEEETSTKKRSRKRNKPMEEVVIRDFAIKLFKTTLTEFKNRLDYVKGDHRFRVVEQLTRQNPRKVVRVWAEKEMRNLTRVRRAGLPCPYPVALVNNLLVMEFIGENGWPAPQLKEANISVRRMEKCYEQVTCIMFALLAQCGLVHADLSEYNILYMHGKCYVIDLGQAVLHVHPKARQFLLTDCVNVTRFFQSRGVRQLIEPEILVDLLMDSMLPGRTKPQSFDEACQMWLPQFNEAVSASELGGDIPEMVAHENELPIISSSQAPAPNLTA